MAFFSQLYLLCWKNLTLRRRKKLRLLVEIIWPIIMFVIVALVRRGEMPIPHKECHFLSKALPSGGLLPFFQSFICDAKSECRQHETLGEAIGHVNNYKDAGLTTLLNDVESVLVNETTMESLKILLAKVTELNQLLQYKENLNNIADTIPGSRSLVTYLKNPGEVKTFLTNDLHLSPSVTQAILDSNVNGQELTTLLNGKSLQSASCDEAQLQEIFGVNDQTTLHEMQKELCNLTTDDYTRLAEELSKQIDVTKLLALLTGGSGNLFGSGLQETSNQPPVYNFLTNVSALTDYMQKELGIPGTDARLLADSLSNPKALSLFLSGRDMRGTVCNTTRLQDYVMTTDQAKLDELSETLCNMSDTDLDKLSAELKMLVDDKAIMNALNGTDVNQWYREVLEELVVIGNQLSQLDSFKNLLKDIDTVMNSNDTDQLVCGSVGQISSFTDFSSIDMTKNFASSHSVDTPTIPKHRSENDTHGLRDDCPWVQQIMLSTNGYIVWKMLKPMVQGFILYTPNTTATNRIMQEAEQPLKSMRMLKDLAYKWLDYSPTLRQYVEDSAAFDLVNKLNEDPELRKALDEQLRGNSTADLILLQKLLSSEQTSKGDNDTFTSDLLQAIDDIDEFANQTVMVLKCVNLNKLKGYNTNVEFQEAAKELQGDNLFWGGAVFLGFNETADNDTIPPHVKYELRMDSNMVRRTDIYTKYFWTPGPMNSVFRFGQYILGGFVFLQDMFDQGIIKASVNKKDAGAGTYIQEFPYPCYSEDRFVSSLGAILPLLMVIVWLFSVAMIIKSIVLEKELRLKEVMKVMGMGNGVHWTAWFINSFLVIFVSSCLLVMILKVGNITIQSQASVLLLMMVSFSVSTITLCFLISTFFSKANLAAACGAVIFFLSYIPYSMAYSWDTFIPRGAKLLLCLSNTIAFGYASQYVALFEIQGDGLTWGNLNETPHSTGEQMTTGQVIAFMWMDAVLYMILTWYIEAVFPGSYGMPRRWYFPFQRSYWCGSQTVEADDADLLHTRPTNDLPTEDSDFEREPTHLKLGVSIRNLLKIYRKGKKLAVNNLSINFYEGQITSFLGHNGAGKTTTMSILTGLFPPTAGTAYVYGKDILTDISEIRKSLGMCPQHNVLFDLLTVEEHLWFYARVKGATNSEIAVEMERMLKHLNLPQKRKELTTNLSGGMKRKLSIAMAFMAGSKTVILDEPTAGVDPYARREIWDLLSKYKDGRTIIMSTHHMDEADVLGDRIAIISSGQLRCSGSSLFLKSRFGIGYYLVLNKRIPGDEIYVSPQLTDPMLYYQPELNSMAFNPASGPDLVAAAMVNLPDDKKNLDLVESSQMKVALEPDDQDLPHKKEKPPVDIPDCGSCQESVVTSFIQSYIPGATLCENLGKELSYILPGGANQASSLQYLFRELEIFKDQLYISDFGISDTSLEEVFLSVTDDTGIFHEGHTQQSDSGLLPRPFMGRGSLRRRGYQLPANSNSIKEHRSRSRASDTEALIGEDDSDEQHQETGQGDSNSLHSVNLNADNVDGIENTSQEANPQDSSHSGTTEQPEPEIQTSRPRVHRQFSRNQRLLRQASRQAIEDSHNNDDDVFDSPSLLTRVQSLFHPTFHAVPTEVTVSSLRMPDAETAATHAADLSGMEVQGFHLIRRQFYALMMKRFHHFRRSKKGFFAQVILPVLFVCVAMLFNTILPSETDTKKLPLVPWLTGTPNNIFYSNDDPGDQLSAGMENSLTENNPGIGTRCMAENPFVTDGYPCDPSSTSDWKTEYMSPDLLEKYENGNLTCTCNGHSFESCEDGAEGPPPPERLVPTTDILQNYTDMNISWYIRTTTLKYIWQRFGGVSFLDTDDNAPLTANISKQILDDWANTETDPGFNIPGSFQPDELLPTDITLDEIYAVMLSLARFKNSKVWWDNNGFHALPAFINVANNILFRGNVEESQRHLYGISTYNYPINLTKDQLDDIIMKQLPINMSTAIFVVFALAFVPASFVVFLIMERQSKSKHLQIVSGISRNTYWVSTLLWDLVNYLIPAILTILVFVCFQETSFIGPNALCTTILLLLMYGWAITPLSYPASFVFKTPSTAYLSLACTNMMIGIITIMTTFILEYLGLNDKSLKDINESLKQVFLIFPPFCLGQGLIQMASIDLQLQIEKKFVNLKEVVPPPPHPLEWNVVGRNIFALAFMGTFSFILTLLIEHKFFFKPKHIKSTEAPLSHEDDDVVKERQRVLSGGAKNDIVIIENLTKDYNTSRGTCRAVDRMCVGIPRGECFGLLGVNGAGKTTTFKMLTGDTQVTSGNAYINGLSILKDMKRISHSIGYCPQFDALNDLLTGEEHLAFYARLRGVPEVDIKRVVEWGIRKLGLAKYAKRVAETYSGGNKRKLSTAIALIGDPQLIFLDEPTTGMDPKARRFLWNRITGIIREGRSVILTSHSMEECEALCTRLAIMVNGQFKCIGSTQHLKSKFGDGYIITIRVGGDPPLIEPLMNFVAETFPQTILRERHFNMLEYQLPTACTSLAEVFGVLGANKERLLIEDYSVCQTTLDQVFISFAKEQKTGDELVQEEPIGMNTVDTRSPGADQIILSPELCSVQYQPETASGMMYGVVVNPLHQEEAVCQPDAKGFTNPLYEAQKNGIGVQGLNSNNSGNVKAQLTDESHKNDPEVVDDCLVPGEGSTPRQTPEHLFSLGGVLLAEAEDHPSSFLPELESCNDSMV